MHKTSKRLLWIGLGLAVVAAIPVVGLVFADLPAFLLSRHGSLAA